MAFVSLGLPDSLLGAAWPMMYPQFQMHASDMGIIAMTISLSTVASSLISDRLNRRFGTGLITAVSVGISAVAILGFSTSHHFGELVLWAIPYGFAAGSVDASLNNYVAIHYGSSHMNWLHCMWGIGVSAGPMIMGYAVSAGSPWNTGFLVVGFIQVVLTIIMFATLPLWNQNKTEAQKELPHSKVLTFRQIFAIPGVSLQVLSLFCYCALESSAGQWASTYFAIHHAIPPESAAWLASLFYAGITVGRAACGFLALKWSDRQMVRIGIAVIFIGLLVMLVPGVPVLSMCGLVLVGVGCAPIYPCIVHTTPALFGAGNSLSIIGVQMASAYTGSTFMPPLFGWISNFCGISIFPLFLMLFLAAMGIFRTSLYRCHPGNHAAT